MAIKTELRPDIQVYDVGDIESANRIKSNEDLLRKGAIHTFGGLIGELIVVFTAL